MYQIGEAVVIKAKHPLGAECYDSEGLLGVVTDVENKKYFTVKDTYGASYVYIKSELGRPTNKEIKFAFEQMLLGY